MLLTAGAPGGAVYVGTEQFLTLAVVLTVLGSVLIFLAKHMFNQIAQGIKDNAKEVQSMKEKLQEQLQENNDKVNERIDKLESKTREEIANVKKDIGDIKGDFATSFVLREDFFRSMNVVEDTIRDTGRKVDKVLMMLGDKK